MICDIERRCDYSKHQLGSVTAGRKREFDKLTVSG